MVTAGNPNSHRQGGTGDEVKNQKRTEAVWGGFRAVLFAV
jgi:hypothetical protein